MKKCPSCGMQYQDTESYCMECGKKLVKMELSEMPPSELMSLMSHIKDMEKEIVGLKESSIPPADVVKIASNASTIKALKDKMTNLERISAAMSPDDLMSLVSQVGELENEISDIEKKIDSLRTTEIPQEILDIEKHGKELRAMRDDIKSLRATIRKDVANVAVAVLKGVKGEICQEVQKFKNVIGGIEERTAGEMKSLREEIASIREAQENIETSGVGTGPGSFTDMMEKRSESLKNMIVGIEKRTDGELSSLREEVSSLAKAQEKAELDRVMPDETIEKKIDDMLSRRMDDVKTRITHDIVREIRKTIGG